MKRYFGAPVIRQGAHPVRHHVPHHGYWDHAHRANNAMPAYAGYSGYGTSRTPQQLCQEYALSVGEKFNGKYVHEVLSVTGTDSGDCKICYDLWDCAPGETNAWGVDCYEWTDDDYYVGVDCDEIDISQAFISEEWAEEEATTTTEQAATTHSTQSAAIAAVKGAKVKNKSDFNKLVGNVKAAYKHEKGKDLSWSKSTPSDALGIAPLFGDLSSAASGASKTQAAITSAAGWFYCNTEKDALKAAGKDAEYKEAEKYCKGGGSSGSSGGGRSSSPPAGSSLGKTKSAQRFYRQTWFYWTAGIVGALVVFGVPTGIMVSKKRKKSV